VTIAEISRELEEEAKKGTPVAQLAPGAKTYPSKRNIVLLQELRRAKGLSEASAAY
jgi:antitoxin (DNA-binding transcriptional repressor) of toxin-antitoxin stability system